MTEFDAEAPFRLMVEAVVDYAVFMLDPQGIVSTWNLGAEHIKGYHADEIVGQHFSVFYPPEAIARHVPEYELSVANAEGRYQDEGWRVRKDGSKFWANVVITALREQDGTLVGFGKVTRDLTQRTLAELTSVRLTAMMACTSDGVIQISRDWVILYANKKAEESLADLEVSKNFWSCFPALLSTPIETHLRTAMEQRTEANYENYYAPYDHWYRTRAFPTDEGLGMFFSDITTEKKLQNQLEAEHVLREKRIEALSHMAGGLAHEISNPLAIIHATASNLKSLAAEEASPFSLKVGTACGTILQTSDRAIRVLRGLRGFSREASKDPVELASIENIIQECLETQAGRFDSLKVEIRLAIQPDIPRFLCRETQIGQIVTNLLNNAFDAITQVGSTERWIALTAACFHSESGDELHLDVTDSGPGIADHFKPHLMEPFFTTKELGAGMGVGLSLSRSIAQDHGGTLRLQKDTEHTCFRLVLPIKPDAALPQVK